MGEQIYLLNGIRVPSNCSAFHVTQKKWPPAWLCVGAVGMAKVKCTGLIAHPFGQIPLGEISLLDQPRVAPCRKFAFSHSFLVMH